MRRTPCFRYPTAVLAALLSASASAVSAQTAKPTGGCLAVSDGRGMVELKWIPPRGQWPLGGWRVQDDRGRVLLPQIKAGEEKNLAGLSPKEVESVRNLVKGLPSFKSDRERSFFFFSLSFQAMANTAYARALGWSTALRAVSPGPQAYDIIALDAAGKPSGPVLKSPPVDAAVASPLPPSPSRLTADSRKEGVFLFWSAAPENPAAPVVYYAVDRACAGGTFVPASKNPVVLNQTGGSALPGFVDPEAPVEQELVFGVYGVDAFGRRSRPAEFRLFHHDWKALEPPGGLTADGQKNKIVLTWKPNPRTKTVFVERATSVAGTYEVITPNGLPGSASSFEDKAVRGGATYFYAVRAAGSRGMMGSPTPPASSRALNPTTPPRPANVKAELGRTRVRLTWEAADFPISGYIIEKRSKTGDWLRLNEEIFQEPRHDDPLGPETSGTFAYRVKAVAFDNQMSAPSAPVEVRVPFRGLPPIPQITGAESKGGKAVVRFRPGAPEDRTSQFLILRSGAPEDEGFVIGRPLPAAAREFADSFVQAGESYWYKVVAVGPQGNRSAPSRAVLVTVGSPPLPVPAAPRAVLVKEPFVRVKITFAAPPGGLEAVVERKTDSESSWLRLPGSTEKTELVDVDPPKLGRVSYRVVFRASNGETGPPSPSATVVR